MKKGISESKVNRMRNLVEKISNTKGHRFKDIKDMPEAYQFILASVADNIGVSGLDAYNKLETAIKNNDKVGLILFSDDVEKYVVPKKGKSHVLRVIRELLYTKPERTGTSLKTALDYLLKVAKRKSVVFVISDFLDDGYWASRKL